MALPPRRSDSVSCRSPLDIRTTRVAARSMRNPSDFAPRNASGRSSSWRIARAAAAFTLCSLLSSGFGFAQGLLTGPRPCPEVTYAGTYHVATGILEPAAGSTSSLVGPGGGVIYRNDCNELLGYYQNFPNDALVIDEGRLPSTSSLLPDQGTVDNYHVTGFRLIYCTQDLTGVFSIRVRFWDQYAFCTPTASAGVPVGDFVLTGLQGSSATGVLECFSVDIDLTGAGLCLRADADEAFNVDAFANRFGFALSMQGQTGPPEFQAGGFYIAGNPSSCAPGEGTYYSSPGSPSGTGLNNRDSFRIENYVGLTDGCYYFGGDPFGGFYLVVTADVSDGSSCTNPPCVLLPTTPTQNSLPGLPLGGARGDLDGDGDRDIVTADGTAGSATLLFNDGTGLFPTAVTLSMPGGSASAAAIGDLNGDGRNDFVVTVAGPAACSAVSTIVAFLNDGLGGFVAQTPVTVGPGPSDVVLCDLDNDGDLDAVTANVDANEAGCPDQSLSLLLNDGAGQFAAATHLPLGSGPSSIALGDLDLDGDPDLVVASPGGTVQVLLGDGAGSFVPQAPLALGGAVSDVALAELDGDGDLDVIATVTGLGQLRLLDGDGLGGLAPDTVVAVAGQPTRLALADFDLDGLTDVAYLDQSGSGVHLMGGTGPGTYETCGVFTTNLSDGWLDAADFDGDGDPDLVSAQSGNQLALYSGTTDPNNAFAGKIFPAGAASFTDAQIAYDPASGGGPTPAPIFADPLAAVGAPDSVEAIGTRTTSIGRGGRLDLRFNDNRLSNSGTTANDLAILEIGGVPERVLVAARPGNLNTLSRLAGIGVTPDGAGFVPIGELTAARDELDLDGIFPGFTSGQLRFDAVRLTDVAASGPQAGPSVGADIDAVGALSSATPTPDLSPTSLTIPTQGFTELPFSVSWTVQNRGDTATSGTWQDVVLLSSDPVLGGDTILGSFASPGGVGAGGSYQRTSQFTYPVMPGTYWIIAVSDSASQLGEGVEEGNNVRVSATSIQVLQLPKPDLQAQVLSIPTVAVDSGSQITIGYRISNTGTAATSSPVWYDHFYLATTNGAGASFVHLGSQTNLSYLSAGGVYEGTFTATLPNDFSGVRYIAVDADGSGNVNELVETNNRAFSASSFVITLEPQPDLVIDDVHFASAPPVTVFSGTFLQVLWTDHNQGPGITNATAWTDRIYLSLDANPSISAGDVHLLDSPYSAGFLDPGQTSARSAQVLIPPATSGVRHVKVITDVHNGISEFGAGLESNNLSVAANPVDVILSITPDLHADAIAATSPGPRLAGHPITFQWSVVVDGFANWNFNFNWVDRLYLSSNPTYEPTDAQVWAAGQSAFFSGGTWLGSTYSKSATVSLPQDTTAGTWFLLARVDSDGSVFEFDANYDAEGNNFVASPAFQVEVQATDLVIAPSMPPDSGAAGQALPLFFQVQNQGSAITPVSSWTDRVWLSSNTTVGGDFVVANVSRGSPLAAGANYTVSTTGTVPLVSPGAWFLLYETDTGGGVWEIGAEGNNVVAVPFTVSPESADLVVDSFLAPTTAQGGQPLSLTWQVSNSGTLATNTSVWTDRVYLSLDAFLDAGDTVLGDRTHSGVLGAGQSYPHASSFQLPLTLSGLWYAIVVSDHYGQVFESDDANNTRLSRMLIDVAQAPPANLTVLDVIAATTATAGQPIAVSWTVRNTGAGSTNVASWPDNLYLSLDQFVDVATDRFLGSYQHAGFLATGEEHVVSQEFLIPSGLAGTYFVVLRTNPNSLVYEAGSSVDNDGSTAVLSHIALPPISDLQVTDVTGPATAVMGNPMNVSWTSTNNIGSTITGQWRDSIYLSADNDLDASDKLLGQPINTAGTLLVGGTHTQNATLTAPGVMPGAYHVLVRSDALNQIPEQDEDNNVWTSAATVDVSAILLSPGDQSVQPMLNGESRYYRLDAPAGLTLRVRFEHQSNAAWTELYVKRGEVPGPGNFDLAFGDPGASQQELVIPVTDGTPYFIQSRVAFGASAGASNATLSTEILPFSVLQATPPAVGSGRVTLLLSGSQLNTLASAALRRTGTGEIHPAIGMAIVDAATAFVAFDLSTAIPGDHDVVALAGGGGTSELLGAVLVEAALPLEAQLTISASPSIKKGSSGQLTARLRNTGNVDIPRTTLVLGTAATSEIQVSSDELGVADLESDGVQDTLLLMVEDLGPGQEVDVPFGLSIGSTYVPDALPIGVAGKPLTAIAFDALMADAAEILRGAVLVDPQSGAGLLARASSASGWLADILAALPPDVSVVHVPGTPPQTGRSFLESLAQAAGAGLPPNDQVGMQALDQASGVLFCAPFLNDAFDCASIAPTECGTALAEVTVTSADGANVPLGVACCSTPTSEDPNEKEEPIGYGGQQQISARAPVAYRIYFENVPTAQAPASLVRITDTLEPAFRASSVRLRAFQFGDTLLTLPPNTISYSATIDRSATLGVLVQITAGVNAATNQVVAIFQSLDPVTGEPVTDGVRGFLPPNDASGRGSGHMDITVGTNGGVVVTGTTARNSATITFDVNGDLTTNETSNTFDVGSPGSNVTVTAGLLPTFDYELAWGGTDELGGSGVGTYTIYASKDGGPYTPIISDTRSTSMTFTADAGHTYRLYSLAKDNTGNQEAVPGTPDVTIIVPLDCNENQVPDSTDISQGTSLDCNTNAIPDECELDGDGDGAIDACDGCPADPAKIAPGVCGCGVSDADTDLDGTLDCNDGCPTDPNKVAPGDCGCGVADTDSDGDATADCIDGCPTDPNKIAPGDCGCGVADVDTDGDATADCIDGCPNDPAKTAPGLCGCGVADTDTDGDATADCVDGCPNDPTKITPGICGCGVTDTDTDLDGTADCEDGCPSDPSKVAPGVCGCGVADTDSDGDATADCIDGCPNDPAKIAPGVCGCGVADTDTDLDGTADCDDGCPTDPSKVAPGVCGCGVADTDTDGDATADCIDGCPSDPAKIAPGICGCGVADTDTDLDGTADCNDGCPTDPLKLDPGDCGCGVADTDSDGDATADCVDGCPNEPAKIAPGICGCGVADTETDLDGTDDCKDG